MKKQVFQPKFEEIVTKTSMLSNLKYASVSNGTKWAKL